MTEYFIIYNVSDGSIAFRGTGPVGIASIQRLSEGQAALVVNESVWAAAIADMDPEALRSALWETIKTLRDAAADGGAQTPSGVVDSDPLSRSNIAGAALAALIAKTTGRPYSVEWTLRDNSGVELNADEMIAVGLAVASHVEACHAQARSLRAALSAASTPSEVLQVNLREGWPA